MPSIYTRKQSPSQQIAVILPNSRRVVRSLHTQDPQKAIQIASKVKTLTDTLTTDQKARQSVLRVLVEDIFIAADVPNPFIEQKTNTPWFHEFAAEYIARKACSQTTKDFIKVWCVNFMESAWEEPFRIDFVTGLMCQSWYDNMSQGINPGTAKNRLAAVASVFAQAVKLGVITKNPCVGLQTKELEDSSREELSDEEVTKLLAWLTPTSDMQIKSDLAPKYKDWITAVMLARYAGCRLGDAVSMTSASYSTGGVLAFTAAKTGEIVVVPMCNALIQHITPLIMSGVTDLCPSLKGRPITSLCSEFGDILDAAGIDSGKFTMNGRTRRRKSFHSLRVSYVNWLMRLGVPEELRKAMAGHTTTAAHNIYVKRSPADLLAQVKPFMNNQTTPL